ncbi:GNAT family N-acetyltransferase [Pseudoneobacillus sp. C159]
MEFVTTDQWDEQLWLMAEPIYKEAFHDGAKSEKIIRNMFSKKLCYLHVLKQNEEVIAMALTGKIEQPKSLLIDYIAVSQNRRSHGIGSSLLGKIKNWAKLEHNLQAIIIEVESDLTSENLKRIDYWQQNNFHLTEYIHKYIWVPEPYLAMYCLLDPNAKLATNGETLFRYITQFHKESFSRD